MASRTFMRDMRGSRYQFESMMAKYLLVSFLRKQLRLVQAWIVVHRNELMADRELAVFGETPYKIEPL